MRPDKETSNAFLYCLAISAERFGIGVIGFGTMSNHYHAVIFDPEGLLPDFLQYFHRLFAVHQNVLRGRWEAFWAPHEQPSAVELIRPDDLVEKLVYAITNPVKDGLVDKLEHWPGAGCMDSLTSAKSMVVARPRRFFRERGTLPDVAKLDLVASPLHPETGRSEWVALVKEKIEAAIETFRSARIKAGKRVVGAKAVLAQHWGRAPASHEPHRTINPHVACRDKWRRIEALQRNRTFLDAYRECRTRWLAGLANVVFPFGVWYLRRFANVKCAVAPLLI